MFAAFLPAVSKDALKRMSEEVRSWRIHLRITTDLAELAWWINPVVSGPDELLRQVLQDRAERPAAAHQHLPGALGATEVQAAQVIQEGQALVARAAATTASPVRPLGLDDRVLTRSDETSGVKGDFHAPFCGSPGVKSPGPPGGHHRGPQLGH
jgi:hypothetical protein